MLSRLAIPAILLLLLTSACKHEATLPTPAKPDTLVFILGGQSNMGGRGAVAPEDTITNPRILEMDDDYKYFPKQEPNTWHQGWLAGLDCGKSFGGELLQRLPAQTTVAIIQCSISNTSIQEWLNDTARGLHLYSTMLARARAGGRTGRLCGVLWMQGESNADDSARSIGYGDNLATLFQRLRGDMAMPALPFYVGRLADWCREPYKAAVNAGNERVATTLPRIHLIQTTDLGMKSDSVHFDAAGQRELGRRFALAALMNL